jgi:transposase
MTRPTYEQLEAKTVELEAKVARLEGVIADLTARLEAAARSGKRQAAPFSKGSPRPNPKTPGRKGGDDYGTKAYRKPPEQIDETHEAPLPEKCPRCGGGDIQPTGEAVQFQVEIPRTPIHRRFNIKLGRCACCGKRVQGRYPLQTSDAVGAAASQLGPDLQALISHLNKDAGLSHGKIAGLLRTLWNITLTRGGSTQAMLRAAGRVGPQHQAVVDSMPREKRVSPDETGWRVGGKSAWLHAVAALSKVCYIIAPGRDIGPVQSVLGETYAGEMTHDGWAPYDRFLLAFHQTCIAHLLRRCKEMIDAAAGRAREFPRRIKELLQDGLGLRDRRDEGTVSKAGIKIALGRLRNRLAVLLVWKRSNAPNERLAKHLARHENQVFTFLERPGMDATNWRAEQAIRPAVVNRKVWGGNRTWAGAGAQSVLMTVLGTCRLQGLDPLLFLSRALRRDLPADALVCSGGR